MAFQNAARACHTFSAIAAGSGGSVSGSLNAESRCGLMPVNGFWGLTTGMIGVAQSMPGVFAG